MKNCFGFLKKKEKSTRGGVKVPNLGPQVMVARITVSQVLRRAEMVGCRGVFEGFFLFFSRVFYGFSRVLWEF